jgi:hypothetical protein
MSKSNWTKILPLWTGMMPLFSEVTAKQYQLLVLKLVIGGKLLALLRKKGEI